MNPDVLVLVEERDGELTKPARQAIGLGLRLAAASGGRCRAVSLGSAAAAQQAAAYGPAAVLLAELDALHAYSPDAWARALGAIASESGCGVLLAPATSRGRDLLPRVAARLGAPMFSECTAIEWTDGRAVFQRALYGGKIVAKTTAAADIVLATLRPNVAEPAAEADSPAPVEPVAVDAGSPRSVVADYIDRSGGQPQVADAPIIVSGGRGLQTPENFQFIVDLAAAMNAAVGASRAVVDAGWIDHSHQVGQTGASVAPALYFACGISGAIQHVAGMQSAGTIVAVNRDADAPIFRIADYGIVGDAAEVLPVLTEKLRTFLG